MLFLSQLSFEIQLILVVISALILGSFATFISHRLAHKQSRVFARSKCINCNHMLGIINLIPLFSWIFQRGKCTACNSKISIRYPAIELSFLIIFLAIFFSLESKISIKMLLYFLIASTMIIMCVIDLEQYFIPNSTQYFLTILVTILVIHNGGTNAAIINIKSAFLYAGFGLALLAFFYIVTKIEALGVDDIKLFFIIGLALGSKNFLTFMLLSGVFGLTFGSIWQKLNKDETFPFAPAICLSFFVCLLFGRDINLVDLLGSMLFFQAF